MGSKNSDDAKPFLVLQSHARDFKSEFDTNVKHLISLLDSKISALIQDADSVSSPFGQSKSVNSHVEFSKAKYEIFVSLTSQMEEMEHNWVEMLAEMRSNFLESVEVFLANTKLDLKPTASARQSFKPARRGLSTIAKSFTSISPTKIISSVYPDIRDLLGTSKMKSPIQQIDDDEIGSDDSSVEVVQKEPGKLAPKRSPATPQTPKLNSSDNQGRPTRSQARDLNISAKEIELSEEEQDDDESIDGNQEFQPVFNPVRQLKRKRLPGTASPLPQQRLERTRSKSLNRSKSQGDEKASPKTPKSVHFSVGMDVNDDLDVYSPQFSLTRSTPRRKTVNVDATLIDDLSSTPGATRMRSKRNTLGGEVLTQASPPKKMKRGRGSLANVSIHKIEENPEESNVSKSNEANDEANYTPWVSLSSIDGKVPAQAGLYELKSAQAKRAAYIGSCDSLRKQLTLHKMMEKCGHKHLDKFIERNINHIQVRYEVVSPSVNIKDEAKARIHNFMAEFNTTPAYN